jgi:hypothetical protein
MSVPTPSGAPRIDTKAPSPPLEPPAVSIVLIGLRVRPNTLLCESAVFVSQVRLYVISRTPCPMVLPEGIRLPSTYHESLRHVGLDVEDSAQVQQKIHEARITL